MGDFWWNLEELSLPTILDKVGFLSNGWLLLGNVLRTKLLTDLILKRVVFCMLKWSVDISIFFARLWGSFYIIFGLLFIITNQLGKTIEMTEDKSFVISTGYVSFLMGLVTVILHNIWVSDWRVVITILAWSTLIKGIQKIGFPEFIHKQAQRFRKKQMFSAAFLILLGAWLFWVSTWKFIRIKN